MRYKKLCIGGKEMACLIAQCLKVNVMAMAYAGSCVWREIIYECLTSLANEDKDRVLGGCYHQT